MEGLLPLPFKSNWRHTWINIHLSFSHLVLGYSCSQFNRQIFFVLFQYLIKNLAKGLWNAKVQICRMQWILFHFGKCLSHENIVDSESIMRFLEAGLIILEEPITLMFVLNLLERQLGVKTWVDPIKDKGFISDLLYVDIFDQLTQFIILKEYLCIDSLPRFL